MRDRFVEDLRRMVEVSRFADGGIGYGAELARAEAGEPMIAHDGWQLGLAPNSGPWCLEADGSITPAVPVFVDPDAEPRTVLRYERLDGSVIR